MLNNMYTEKKQLNWAESRIKGRIAETIVEELFRTLGFKVYPNGVESIAPQTRGQLNKISLQLRRRPDFYVINEDGEEFLLEVKFRASGEFIWEQVKDNPYNNALIVLVTRKHIKCLSIAELKRGNSIVEGDRNYLGNRKEFRFDRDQKDIIVDFCEFALKYFSTV